MNTPHYLPRFVIFQVLTHLISPIINNMIRYRGSLRRVCFRIYFIQKWTTWETNRFVLPRLGTTWSLLPVMKKHFERLRSCVWMLCNLVEMLGHTNNWGGQPCINLFFFFRGFLGYTQAFYKNPDFFFQDLTKRWAFWNPFRSEFGLPNLVRLETW